jgi:Family of unknown function (DUF5677)
VAKKRDKARRRRTQTPISGHKRDRKKLVTPMNALPNMRPTDWVADLLPELLWVAAMLREYDEPVAAWNVLEALEPFVDEPWALDGHMSAFALVPEDRRPEALEALDERGVPALPDSFGHALSLYPDCPAAWLYARWSTRNTPDIDHGIGYLKGLVADNFAWRTEPATRLRLVTIGRLVHHSRIRVSPDWLETSYIPRYPGGLTDDERRAAESEIRAMYGALHAASDMHEDTEWSRYFWRQSYRVSVCELPGSQLVAADDPETDTSDEPGPTIADLWTTFRDAAEALTRELADAQQRVEIDLYAPEATEVKLGLASRQVRLLRVLLSDPHLWAAANGAHILRALVDTLITTSWLLLKNESELYLRFRTFGLGRLKLFKLHFEDYFDQHENPSQEQLEFVESLDEEVNFELLEMFTDIDLGGNFSGVSIRDMAKEAGIDQYYNLGYQPYSSEAHGDWVSLRRSDLTHCRNPLHRFHRLARFNAEPSPGSFEMIDAAIGVVTKSVSEVFSDLGVDVTGAFDRFRAAIFEEKDAAPTS